jgi:carbon-monoxide dehydrogenase medium subunit
MYDFDYVRPASLSDAAARMAASPEARLMSGGMTLIPTLKQRLAQPSHVIHVGLLDELRGICRDGDALGHPSRDGRRFGGGGRGDPRALPPGGRHR